MTTAGPVPTAFLFPGQGSQYVGMGKDLFETHAAARNVFLAADSALGVPLSRICFEGPVHELTQTMNTQPAIFIHSIALLKLLGECQAAAVAGHSLGEYSALVMAGAISWEDGLRLVRLRGELMQKSGEVRQGTMAAIVGLAPADLNAVCADASGSGVVQCANFNSPGQIVISGSVSGVRKGMELAKERGAKLVKELTVSGAFHSPLMEPAREGLMEALNNVTISDARMPVYANVTAKPEQMAEKIRTLLGAQLTSAVQWESTITNMISDGIRRFVEIGPGKVLRGLVKRIDPAALVTGIDTSAELEKFLHGGRS